MIIKINGNEIIENKVQQPLTNEQEIMENKVGDLFEHHLLPLGLAAGFLNVAKAAFAAGNAAGLADKLMPLVHMIQDFALPVGIIVATWGLIEIMIGNPGGKQKIKFAVIGYCGIFIVPEVFYAIRSAFR